MKQNKTQESTESDQLVTKEKHYQTNIRTSKKTKELLLVDCAIVCFGKTGYKFITQGIILRKIGEEYLELKQQISDPTHVDLGISLFHDIDVLAKKEFLKYNETKKAEDVTTKDLIKAMTIHYLESDPR